MDRCVCQLDTCDICKGYKELSINYIIEIIQRYEKRLTSIESNKHNASEVRDLKNRIRKAQLDFNKLSSNSLE